MCGYICKLMVVPPSTGYCELLEYPAFIDKGWINNKWLEKGHSPFQIFIGLVPRGGEVTIIIYPFRYIIDDNGFVMYNDSRCNIDI